jgi:hypothetical protein
LHRSGSTKFCGTESCSTTILSANRTDSSCGEAVGPAGVSPDDYNLSYDRSTQSFDPRSLPDPGIRPARSCCVFGFVFLIIGLICAVISRILLLIAALDVSVWWALGVFLPFGPLLFRLSYPDLAQSSRIFRLAMLPCFAFFLILGPGPLYKHHVNKTRLATVHPFSYGLESHGSEKKSAGSSAQAVQLAPNLQERRAANVRELQRLAAWNEALRIKKRDLLHSDVQGNRSYEAELAQYNAALEKATAEKNAVAASGQ